jgi:hypothetical protein
MAGLVPAIHVLPRGTENVDARDKPGHNDVGAHGLNLTTRRRDEVA